MALDLSVLSQLHPVAPPPNPIEQMQHVVALKNALTQGQDLESQIALRKQEAQMREIQNQKAIQAANIIGQHIAGGGKLDDEELQGKIAGVNPDLALTLQTHVAGLKKTAAETGAAAANAAHTKMETDAGVPPIPVQGGQTLWDRVKGTSTTVPLNPLQTSETRKNNAEALGKELESGNFPKDATEAQSRLDAIAPPEDKDLGGVNTRFSAMLKAGNQTPAYFASTLKDALSQADKVAGARAQAPIKIEQSIATANAGAAGATGAGLDLMAEQALNGSFSSRNPALMSKVYQRAADMAKERGLTNTGVIMAQNAAKANKQALDTMTNQQAQVEAFSQTAEKNMKVLEGAMGQVSDLGAPFMNTPMRNLQSKFSGNPKVTAFYAALQPVQTEIAKILNSSNASGVLTDNARNEMQAALGPGATPAQLKAALDIFRSDISNRKSTFEAMIQDLTGKTAVGAGSTPNAGGGVAPEGTVIHDGQGNAMIKRNGQWVKQ